MKEKKKSNDLLFSVVVITYNSSVFIEETLDSIYNQTYKNIELIISDDASTDNTIDICKNWLKKNSKRFIDTHLSTVESNTGIPSNINRGIRLAKGAWIKGIAGDDAMFKEGIKYGVDYIHSNKEVCIFSSDRISYRDMLNDDCIISKSSDEESSFFKLSSAEQYSSLLYENRISAVSMFFKKSLIDEVGGFDESIRFMEDHPMWLTLTKKGVKIFHLAKVTVKYRVHGLSVRTSDSNKSSLFNRFYLKIRSFQKVYIYPNISAFGRFSLSYEYYRHYIIDSLGLNRKNIICKSIYRMSGIISPIKLKSLYS